MEKCSRTGYKSCRLSGGLGSKGGKGGRVVFTGKRQKYGQAEPRLQQTDYEKGRPVSEPD
ncbi:hypothetical protein [Syntrophomonas curvata]